MEFSNGVLSVDSFLAFTLVIMVPFVGRRINSGVAAFLPKLP